MRKLADCVALGLLVFAFGCTSESELEDISEVIGAVDKSYEVVTFKAPLASSTPLESVPDTPVPAAEDAGDDPAGDSSSEHNPRVLPGLVEWHATFDDACAAARESGRPVLLFQLMGNLNQRFT